MKKQSTQPSIVTVGIDAGYGATKGVIVGQPPVVFPSVAGYARDIKFNADDLLERYPGEQITDDMGDWFVGRLAQSQLKAGELYKMRGRGGEKDVLGIEFRIRMIKVALGRLLGATTKPNDVVHVRVASGLPVEHMKDRDNFKRALLGSHHICTDQADFVANIVDAPIMPQPIGALYSQTLTKDGDINPCHVATKTGIADVGMFTVDVAYDNDGEYIDSRSGSISAGVFTVHERITELLRDVLDDEPDYADVERVLRTGCLRVNGEDRDFKTDVDRFLEPLRTATLQLMIDKWGRASTLDVIYLVGGGASLVFDDLKAAYPVTELVHNPQLAVAQGYLNYAAMSK